MTRPGLTIVIPGFKAARNLELRLAAVPVRLARRGSKSVP